MDHKVKAHYYEYDVLRVVATLLVLLGHCTYLTISTNYGGINYEKYFVFNAPVLYKMLSLMVAVIYTFHMPLFIALSGALFCLQLPTIKSAKDLLRNKFNRLLIPFLAVSLFYSIPIKYLSHYFQSHTNLVRGIFLGQLLLQGDSYLWFLEALFFDFAIVYLLEKHLQLNLYPKLFLLLILYGISFFTPVALVRYPFRYAVWFYMGHLFEKKRSLINKKLSPSKFALSIFLFGLFCAIRWVLPKYPSYYIKAGLQAINIIITLLGCLSVYCFSYLLSKTQIIHKKYYRTLLADSYGIYLYSDPWNYAILAIFGGLSPSFFFNTNLGAMALFLLRLFFTGAVSILITELLKKRKLKYLC